MSIPSRLARRPSSFDVAAILSLALTVSELPLASAFGQAGPAASKPFTVVERGRSFARLQDAVDAIGGGKGTIRFAPGHFRECTVQDRGTITYTAEVAGQSVLEQRICEGKAALVLRGRGARIEGLVFADLRVADGNGAGIRLERGNLAVSQSWFRNSEEGILTANDPASSISIDKSTFTHLGRCDRGLACAHSIYTGDYGSVSVTRSRFEAGDGGHYLKSRAARVTVTDNAFDDAKGSDTNYMIDLPAGATGRIAGNWFMQGTGKENHSAFIAIAAESHDHSADGLAIEGNIARFVSGLTWTSAFVADWSGDRIAIGANQLADGIEKYQRR